MKLPILYKKSSTGKISQWEIEVSGRYYRTISGYTDGEKVTSAFKECYGKNEGKKNSTTPEEQAIAEAKALHKKRKELGSFENIKDVDKKVYYKPMLANKLEDYVEDLTYPVFSQPKLDGVRCIAKEDGLWTRNGKPLLSAPHIYNDLKPLFKKFPDLILDGELYCDKLSNDFNKIISLVKKTKPTQEDLDESELYIQFHIYDLPSSEKVFIERSIELDALPLPHSCVLVSTCMIESGVDILPKYEEYIAAGYEGQMIRTNNIYQNKRSKYLLKDKSFIDNEYVVKQVIEGKGNLSNKVGKLVFDVDGVEVDAAVNATWEELEKLWKDKDKLIGKTVTVKHFGKTPDGSLRFPKITQIAREEWE